MRASGTARETARCLAGIALLFAAVIALAALLAPAADYRETVSLGGDAGVVALRVTAPENANVSALYAPADAPHATMTATDATQTKLPDMPGQSRYTLRLTGLQPATRYTYQVRVGDRIGPSRAFTAAAKDADLLTFAYLGDTQSDPQDARGYAPLARLMASVAKDAPAFACLGGDLINEETDAAEWNAFWDAGAALFHTMPIMTATGNHTYGQTYRALFCDGNDGPSGFGGSFYSFNAGNAHFVVLDSNRLGDATPEVVQALSAWLRQDLSGTQATWKIVMLHHPLFPVYNTVKDVARAQTMCQNYLPILEEQGTDLVLCGHQHCFARSYPMLRGEVSTHQAGGVLQLLGTSGAKAYAGERFCDMATVIPATQTYTLVTLCGDSIALSTRDASGALLDAYSWEK